MHGADAAGVGERDRDTREVLGGELAVTRAPDDVLVRAVELREVVGVGVLDRGDDEGSVAVLARQVDGQAEVGVCGGDRVGLAVDLAKCRFMFGNALTACTIA